jgi:hypothetical protein
VLLKSQSLPSSNPRLKTEKKNERGILSKKTTTRTKYDMNDEMTK